MVAFTNNSENVLVNKHEYRGRLLLLLPVRVSLILSPVLGEDEDIDECKFFFRVQQSLFHSLVRRASEKKSARKLGERGAREKRDYRQSVGV